MAAVGKGKDLGGVEGAAALTHRIRITLTSQTVEALEKGAFDAPPAGLLSFFFCRGRAVSALRITCHHRREAARWGGSREPAPL